MNGESLSDALAAVERGEPISEILARYREQATELHPYLELVQQLRATPPPPMPERWKEAEARFLEAAQARRAARSRPPAPWGARLGILLRRPLPALLVVALLFLVFGIGTVKASADALPGDPLYSVKRTDERLRLALSPASARPGLSINYAERRLSEIERLLQAGSLVPSPLVEDLVRQVQEAERWLEQTPRQNPEEWQALGAVAGRALETLDGLSASGGSDPATIELATRSISATEERARSAGESAPPVPATPTKTPESTPTRPPAEPTREKARSTPPGQQPASPSGGRDTAPADPPGQQKQGAGHGSTNNQKHAAGTPAGKGAPPGSPPGQHKATPQPTPRPGKNRQNQGEKPAQKPPAEPGPPPHAGSGGANSPSGPPAKPPATGPSRDREKSSHPAPRQESGKSKATPPGEKKGRK